MSHKILKVLVIVLASLALAEANGLASGSACTQDSQCQQFYVCSEHDDALTCNHKSIFPHPDSKELGGLYLSIIANALTNAAGVGTGALFVPYLTLLNNYTPGLAVSYTYPLVFSGGVGSMLNTVYKRHPETKRPLVNYNIVCLCIPMLLVGVPIGVLLKKAMCPLLINLLLFCAIIFSLLKTYKNYRRNRNKEKELFAREKAEKEAKIKESLQTEEILPTSEKPALKEAEIELATQGNQEVQLPTEGDAGRLEANFELKDKNEKEVITSDSENVLEKQRSLGRKKSQNSGAKLIENPDSADSKKNYLSRHLGDNSFVNDEMYELGINTFTLFLVDNPEKVIAQARENERRLTIERRRSTHERRKTEELKLQAEAIAQGKSAEEIQLEQLKREENRKKMREEIEKYEKRLIHWEKVLIAFTSLVVIVVLNLIAGNGTFASIVGIKFCSGGYWGIFVLQLLIEMGLFFTSLTLVLRTQRKKDACDWEYRPEDVRFNRNKIITIFLVGIMAGMSGGILAIGGGMIFSPFLLEFGMPPQPLAASVVWFLAATQFSTMFLGILLGYFTAPDLCFLIGMALLFSFSSTQLVNWIVKKTRRQSIILLNLMIIVFISFITNIASTSISMRDNKTFMLTFTPICHH